jgi:hypothetical protein
MNRPKSAPSRGRKPGDKDARRPDTTPVVGKGKGKGEGGIRPASVDRRPTAAPAWKTEGKRREA